jgi:hypothetical protein
MKTTTKSAEWLSAVAAAPDLQPAALRIAVAVATTRSADLAALVERLNITREEAAEAVDALVAAGFARLRLEPTTPPGAPRPSRLSPAARRALGVLADLGTCHSETWRAAVVETMPEATADARRQAWKRSRDALVSAGLVEIDADGIVTAKEPTR